MAVKMGASSAQVAHVARPDEGHLLEPFIRRAEEYRAAVIFLTVERKGQPPREREGKRVRMCA